jgi:hypothetical protein
MGSTPDHDIYSEEPPSTVEEVDAHPTTVDLSLEFDPGNLEPEDIEAINSVILSELISTAVEEQGVSTTAVPRGLPGFPGGGFTKHSKSHSKYGGYSKTRSRVTTGDQEPEPARPDNYPAARPHPHSKTPGYSKSYSKYIHGKIGG